MTRARSKAIEDKVNSLLSEIPLSTQETWLLPQTETLCVIRYNAEEEATGVNSLLSPEPARNFRPPELPASFDIDHPRRANFLLSPEPARNLARNFRSPEPPARPGTSGPPEASSTATVPIFGLGRTLPGTSGPACVQPLGPRPVYPFVT